MPHPTTSSLGLQAFILCGPGEGITLIAPPECAPAIETALSQNPYLTSLPSSPRITLLSPAELDLTTGTAEIFQFAEVQSAIVSDYVVLPCDLVCEISGRALWETWTVLQPSLPDIDSARSVQKGGMGVWYQTKDATEHGVGVKKEETDFLATTDLDDQTTVSSLCTTVPLRSRIREVALAMPTDSLQDQLSEKEHLRIRSALFRRKRRATMQVKLRDAHMYFMPHWSKHLLRQNRKFESFGEDVVGSWAKARWQRGLDRKLGFGEALRSAGRRKSSSASFSSTSEDVINLAALSSTGFTDLSLNDGFPSHDLATRVPQEDRASEKPHQAETEVPPFLSYTHPALHVPSSESVGQQQSSQKEKQQTKGGQQQQQESTSSDQPPSPLIRRADTVKLLLSVSLYLARLPNILTARQIQVPNSTHPFCHAQQVHSTSALPSQATISTQSVLIDANCTLQPRITIRDSAIGANCSIASGSRLHGCLLMEGVVIEERVMLSGCVVGRRCKIGSSSELRDCSIQDGYVVAEGTTSKGEVLAGFDEGTEFEEGEEGPGDGGIDFGAV
ncbi:MAG: hypothetical protein Q9159_007458 [Coniocarpon cinnabarinum]